MMLRVNIDLFAPTWLWAYVIEMAGLSKCVTLSTLFSVGLFGSTCEVQLSKVFKSVTRYLRKLK